MITLGTLIAYLEVEVPSKYKESYDNVGLIFGNLEMEVKGVLTTLDVTKEVLQEAISQNCNVILAHHPLIFTPMYKFENCTPHNTLLYAIRHNLAIYTLHTNLDVIPEGVNKALAEAIGLNRLEILAPKDISNEKNQVGFGMIGYLLKSYTSLDFLRYLKKKLNLSCIRHTKLLSVPIKKVAVMGGVGISALSNAIASSADAFVTSDIKYHQFFEAEKKLFLVDIGHYESENCTKKLLANLVSKKFSKIATYISQIVTNPIHYYV